MDTAPSSQERLVLLSSKLEHLDWQASDGLEQLRAVLKAFFTEDCESNVDHFLAVIVESTFLYMSKIHGLIDSMLKRRDELTSMDDLETLAISMAAELGSKLDEIPLKSGAGDPEFYMRLSDVTRNCINLLSYGIATLMESDISPTPAQQKMIDDLKEAISFFAHDALGEKYLLLLQRINFYRQYGDRLSPNPERSIESYKASLQKARACTELFLHRLKPEVRTLETYTSFDVQRILEEIFTLLRIRDFNFVTIIARNFDLPDTDKRIFDFGIQATDAQTIIEGSPDAFFLTLWNITKNIFKLVQAKYGERLESYVQSGEQSPEIRFPVHVTWRLNVQDGVLFLEYLDDGVGLAFTEILENIRGMAVEAIKQGKAMELKAVAARTFADGSYASRSVTIGDVTDMILEKAVTATASSSAKTGHKGSGLGLYEAKTLLRRFNGMILASPRLQSRGVKILIAVPLDHKTDPNESYFDTALRKYMAEADQREVEEIRALAA